MQLGLAHRALEAEQQAIVEVRRVVDAILVEDERVGERANLEQAMPVGGVAREAGHLESEHDAGASHANLRDELLEALAVRRRRARLAEVGVDDDDAVARPAERDGALAQRVLALGALGILHDLPHRRLPDVQVRGASEMARGDLLLSFVHACTSGEIAIAMVANTPITSA